MITTSEKRSNILFKHLGTLKANNVPTEEQLKVREMTNKLEKLKKTNSTKDFVIKHMKAKLERMTRELELLEKEKDGVKLRSVEREAAPENRSKILQVSLAIAIGILAVLLVVVVVVGLKLRAPRVKK